MQTWVTLLGVLVGSASVGIALLAYLRGMRQELKSDIASTRAELKGDIGQTWVAIDNARAEFKGDISSTRVAIDTLRAEFKADLGEVRADFRFLSERMINFLAHPPERRAQTQGE